MNAHQRRLKKRDAARAAERRRTFWPRFFAATAGPPIPASIKLNAGQPLGARHSAPIDMTGDAK